MSNFIVGKSSIYPFFLHRGKINVMLDANESQVNKAVISMLNMYIIYKLGKVAHFMPIYIYFDQFLIKIGQKICIQFQICIQIPARTKAKQAAVSCKLSQLPRPRRGWLACLYTIGKASLITGNKAVFPQWIISSVEEKDQISNAYHFYPKSFGDFASLWFLTLCCNLVLKTFLYFR